MRHKLYKIYNINKEIMTILSQSTEKKPSSLKKKLCPPGAPQMRFVVLIRNIQTETFFKKDET